jgi:hypothetical protein
LDEIKADDAENTFPDKIDGSNVLDTVTQTTAIFDNNDAIYGRVWWDVK